MSRRAPCALRAQLAGLAALEANTHLALRAVYAAYPEAARSPADDEDFDITSARSLADVVEDLLLALDTHRSRVAHRLRVVEHPDQTAWPF